jgi:membrane protease subunit HflK
MPWINQGGGGPWGSGGGGGSGGNNGSGWGSGGPGGGPQGPDIEELLRRGQDKLRGFLPGKLGGKGFPLIILIVVAIWMGSGFYTIAPEEQGVVLRFGDYNSTSQPGLNYHLPYPVETVIKVPVLTVRRVEIGYRSGPPGSRGQERNIGDESLMLTGDENIIDVNFVAQWAVKDAGAFAFNIRNPSQTVKDAGESAMREVIGKSDIASALAEGRQQVAQETHDLLQKILDEYNTGIIITELLLQRADPPQAVIESYRDVQRAKADQERLINEADAFKNRVVPEANGQAAQLVAEAQAYREQVVARAEGAAQRFISVYEEYRLAKVVTKQRIYLETMEKVFQDMNKVVIDSGSGGAGVVPYLPLPELQKRAQSSNSTSSGDQ